MIQDVLTKAQSTMDLDHAYVHEQKAFSIAYDTGSLAHTTGKYAISIKTPANSKRLGIHLRPTTFSSTASLMKLDIHEDTVSTSGEEVQLLNHWRKGSPKISHSVFTKGVTAALAGKTILAATAGGNFGNQPNNDGVEILSNNNADKGQIVTLYGTLHGATSVIVSEQLVLNGTTVVSSTKTNWSVILGVEITAGAAGTVTIREASADQTIITLATTVLSAGVHAATDTKGRDQKMRIKAAGASTKWVGVLGTSPAGLEIGYAAQLDGTTEKDLSLLPYRTVSKILIGDVASASTATVIRPEIILETVLAGAAGATQANSGGPGGGSQEEWVLDPDTNYVINVSNIGTSAASIAYVKLFFYEEEF